MTTAACARPPAGFQQPQHLCSRGGSASSDAPAGATYCWPSTSPQHPKKLGRWETEPDPLPDSQTSAVPRCRWTQPREPGLQPPRAPPAPQPHPAVPRCHPAAGPQQPREPSERSPGGAPGSAAQSSPPLPGQLASSSGAAEQRIQELTLRW